MITTEHLIQTFRANYTMTQRLLDGVTQTQACTRPPMYGEHMQDILEHILNLRYAVLNALGQPDDDFPKPHAITLRHLLRDLERTQTQIEQTLTEASPQHMEIWVKVLRGEVPRWRHVSGLSWHETYYLGQLEVLRKHAVEPSPAA